MSEPCKTLIGSFPYQLVVKDELKKLWPKLQPWQQNAIRNKLPLILSNPNHFKNLRVPMQRLKRVHINSHFVLLFSVDEVAKTVTLEDFDHHDMVYGRKS